MTLRLDYTVASDRGLVRDNTEDSAYAGPNLLVIADGMGGHAAGEVASQLMVNHLARLDAKATEAPEELPDADKLALLAAYSDDANREIAETVRRRPETEGMGTTLTAMLFDGRELALIHAGDSRGYLLRDGVLEQVTVDDTFVQSLVNEGKLDPGDVSSHPRKSLILKAYTGQPVEPTLGLLDARPGDRLLLCSDGLHHHRRAGHGHPGGRGEAPGGPRAAFRRPGQRDGYRRGRGRRRRPGREGTPGAALDSHPRRGAEW